MPFQFVSHSPTTLWTWNFSLSECALKQGGVCPDMTLDVALFYSLFDSPDHVTNLKWSTQGDGRLWELKYHYNWDPYKALQIGKWSICRGGRLMRLYCLVKWSHGFDCI